MVTITGLTVEVFEGLPEVLTRNRELIEGELVDVSGNTGNHNRLRDALVELMSPFVREHQLGLIVSEQEFAFGDSNAFGPDVSFLDAAKAKLFDGKRRVQLFVPDLVIEIVSQNDTFDRLITKAVRYRACGTQEVFIFSIGTRQVFLYSDHLTAILTETQDFRPAQIPGFSIRIADLFARI